MVDLDTPNIQKIEAIKLVRQVFSFSLKDAKGIVESYHDNIFPTNLAAMLNLFRAIYEIKKMGMTGISCGNDFYGLDCFQAILDAKDYYDT